VCRDGSSLGYTVNETEGSTDLLVFLQGGGLCYDEVSCAANRATVQQRDFTGGVFDRADPANPFATWTTVFVPYCSGDFWVGDASDITIAGVAGLQQFHGRSNVAALIASLTASFAPKHIVVAGSSAGGYGAALNYSRFAAAFPSATMQAIDDSGPFVGAPALAPCLISAWSQAWGLGSTVFANGATDFPSVFAEERTSAPNVSFGIIESWDDYIIREILGRGQNGCTGTAPLDGTTFDEGLSALVTQFSGGGHFFRFYYPGVQHQTLWYSAFDTTTRPWGDGGVEFLSQWVGALSQ